MPEGESSCPDYLTGEARAEWDRLSVSVAPGLLCRADVAVLAAFCACHGRLVEAELKVAELGAVITTTKGELKINPWQRVADEQRKQLRGLAAELGLSPSSRGRVTPVFADKGDDPISALFAARKERESEFSKFLNGKPSPQGLPKRTRA